MDRLRRDVILIRLIEALRKQGSWCGETHVQKAAYLLQELVGAQTGFEFILYKHGPFSFELRDELSAMRADGFVSLRMQHPDYGPSIVPEAAAEGLRKRFQKTLRENESRVEFVAQRLGNKPVVELERLATAYFVWQEKGAHAKAKQLADRVHELKPHISVDQAMEVVQTVETWRREAAAVSA